MAKVVRCQRRGAFKARLLPNVAFLKPLEKPWASARQMGKSPALGSRKAAKGARKGAAERLKPVLLLKVAL